MPQNAYKPKSFVPESFVPDSDAAPAQAEESLASKAYNFATTPLLDIPEMSDDNLLGRAVNWGSSRIIEPMTSPVGLATIPLMSLRLARLGLGAAGAAYGAYNAPSAIKKAYDDPTLENVGDAALDTSMVAGAIPALRAARGRFGGAKNILPKPLMEPEVPPTNSIDPKQPFKTAEGLAEEAASTDDYMKTLAAENQERRAANSANMPGGRRASDAPITAPKPKYKLNADGSYTLISETPVAELPITNQTISTSTKQRAAHVKRILKANDEARAADPTIPKMSIEEARVIAQQETTAGLDALVKKNNPPPNKPPSNPMEPGDLPPDSVPSTPLQAGTYNPGLLGQINNFAKTTLTSYDISAPGRQALPLWHTKAFWTSWDDMFRAWGSEKAYNNIMQGIADRELFKPTLNPDGKGISSIAERAGLDLRDIKDHREERFGSKLAEKLPLVKRSERAYTAFLNKVRADHFETLYRAAEAAGHDMKGNGKLTKDLAEFINTATGRGSLGSLEKHAQLLNDHLFAPRFYASRLKMLNPMWYAKQEPFVRKQALKSLLALTSLSMGVTTLAEMSGLEVSRDRMSSDYGKIKIGNTRLDPHAGFQQYEVLGNKLVGGLYDMYANGNLGDYGKYGPKTDPLTQAENFALGKLNPVQSFIVGMMRGRDFDNQPFEFKKGLMNRVAPIMMQDMGEILQEDPSLLWMIAPASIGMGVQTYGR